jgi:outer membrane cobalamin receptor
MWEPFRKHAFFNLSVSNIFDERYETSKGYPAAGRSVYLTAEYRF